MKKIFTLSLLLISLLGFSQQYSTPLRVKDSTTAFVSIVPISTIVQDTTTGNLWQLRAKGIIGHSLSNTAKQLISDPLIKNKIRSNISDSLKNYVSKTKEDTITGSKHFTKDISIGLTDRPQTVISSTASSMRGSLSMNGSTITNLASGTEDGSAVNLSQLKAKQNLIASPTAYHIVTTNSLGQTQDGGKIFNDAGTTTNDIFTASKILSIKSGLQSYTDSSSLWQTQMGIGYTPLYGRLYNWYAVNTGKLCPTGWHVPSNDEWITLQNYLIANGYNYDGSTTGTNIAKSMASTTGWASSTTTGAIGNSPLTNNTSGFTALPGGLRSNSGTFVNISYYGGWWSSPEQGTSSAYYRSLYYDFSYLYDGYGTKVSGFSVRCLRNDNPNTSIISDADNNVYNVIAIGSQYWLKQNLATTKYNDGTAIPNVTDGATWAGLTTGAYCNYNNSMDSVLKTIPVISSEIIPKANKKINVNIINGLLPVANGGLGTTLTGSTYANTDTLLYVNNGVVSKGITPKYVTYTNATSNVDLGSHYIYASKAIGTLSCDSVQTEIIIPSSTNWMKVTSFNTNELQQGVTVSVPFSNITVQRAGKYQVSYYFSSSSNINTSLNTCVFVNGVKSKLCTIRYMSAYAYVEVSAMDVLTLTANDQIDVRVCQNSGSQISLNPQYGKLSVTYLSE